MTALTVDAIRRITRWGEHDAVKNTSAVQSLLDSAEQSSYFAGQLNAMAERGFEFKVGERGKGTKASRTNRTIFIDPDAVDEYMQSSPRNLLLATLFAHEMGHMLSPGGSEETLATSPEDVKNSSHKNEGVAIGSEIIVGFQLRVSRYGMYTHSDNGQTGQPAGDLTRIFESLAGKVDLEVLTFDSALANQLIDPSGHLVYSLGYHIGQGQPSGMQITYDQYNVGWWAISKCLSIDPGTIDWSKLHAEDLEYSYDELGVCHFRTANPLPLLKTANGSSLTIDARITRTGIVVSSALGYDSTGDGKSDQLKISLDLNHDGHVDRFIDTGNSIQSMLEADKQIDTLYKFGQLGSGFWDFYTGWSTSQLVGQYGLTPDLGMDPWGLGPIGAFYESRSAAFDSAASIADRTIRILDRNGGYLAYFQMARYDTNGDNMISGSELEGLGAWRDFNQDGHFDQQPTGRAEFTGAAEALAELGLNSIRASEYGYYTAGSSTMRRTGQFQYSWLGILAAPGAAASDFYQLRNTDQHFEANNMAIDWLPSQVKLSSNQENMVGTEGDDRFDAVYYSKYDGTFFNLDLVKNFYGGGGNDVVSGSARGDSIWGDSGDDKLWGQGGNDSIYGGEGDDELQGGDGGDVLIGETGNDKLIGQAGNDVLNGGDGADTLIGFMASNQGNYLAPGDTDDDQLFGGHGDDTLLGGLGQDYLYGGEDNDTLVGEAGLDILLGGAGDDHLSGGQDTDLMDGGSGADLMFGGAGDDSMWGGDGNDVMLGFTGANDTKQVLAVGETDNDLMVGGSGNDIMLGGLGNDAMWGNEGNDKLLGGEGHDGLYGEDGDDNLFGGAGDDTLYGGSGNDFLCGGAASDELALSPGTLDNNFLYGGEGSDILIGGIGSDYLDGGAGADRMEGGLGHDTYVVNSVNDVVMEQADEGYDSVISSANYILNANIEGLYLVEGFVINGTGNRLDNHISGNGQDNILDGVTGADFMAGGPGSDTYYVDNAGDLTVEVAGEGTDTVNASVSHALATQVENLNLLDFSMAESGIADGVSIRVYGYPKAFELDYMQGDAMDGFRGTCALTSIANLGTQASQAMSEEQVLRNAIENDWCTTDTALPDYKRGGSDHVQQQALLDSYGIRNGIVMGYDEQAIANLIRGGRGVIIGLNAGRLWNDAAYFDNGEVNHVVTVTGVACDAATGNINGFYIADSGRGLVSDMTRYVAAADFRTAAEVASAYSIHTLEPIKLWNENIDATGNELDNRINGNRGDNRLAGGAGNDILAGGRGNDILAGGQGGDTYRFARGDGQDVIIESEGLAGAPDTLELSGFHMDDLSFTRAGADLWIGFSDGSDQITVRDWYQPADGAHDALIETVRLVDDGLELSSFDVDQLVQQMAWFSPVMAANGLGYAAPTRPEPAQLATVH